jgi:hypothetical protein
MPNPQQSTGIEESLQPEYGLLNEKRSLTRLRNGKYSRAGVIPPQGGTVNWESVVIALENKWI